MRCIITSFLMVSCWTLCAIAQTPPTGQEPTVEAAGGSSKIEFRIAESQPSEGLVEAAIKGSDEKIYLYKSAVLTNDDIAYAVASGNTGGNPKADIEIGFTEAGSRKMSEATKANTGRIDALARLAVIVDGEVISASTIRDVISGKTLIAGAFSAEEARRIARDIAPRPAQVNMLLVKADWSQLETAETELRKALDGAAVPQALLDRLPVSGPEILFATETMSLYTPQHYVDLLAWLKAKGLVISIDPFSDGEFMHVPAARVYGEPIRVERRETLTSYSASLDRPMDFLDVPAERVREFVGNEVPRPFITKRALFRWHIKETPDRSSERQIMFSRKVLVLETARGRTWRESGLLDSSRFEIQIPAGHVAITNAFPDDDEFQFRDAARRKGFVALIVSEPATAKSARAADEGRVRPPDMISTLATKYGGNDFWPQESNDEEADYNLNTRQDDLERTNVLGQQTSTVGNIERLQTEYEENERAARDAAAALREQVARDPRTPEIAQKKGLLKLLVAKSLALRVGLHELELAELEEKLKHARETIRQRRQITNQIIDRRVEDLLNPQLNGEAGQPSTNSASTEVVPSTAVYVWIRPKSFALNADEVAVHKRLVTSDAVLASAVRDSQLNSLPLIATQPDQVSWLRENLIVRSTSERSVEIALTGDPDSRPQLVKIVNAVRVAYEQFVEDYHQSTASETIKVLSAERDEVQRQLATAQAEYEALRSGDGTTEAEEKTAKSNVAKIQGLLDTITAMLAEIDLDDDE